MRHRADVERLLRLGENSLFLVGEEQAFLCEERRLMELLSALDESDDLQEAEAQAAVDEAEVQLRKAKYRLVEIVDRNQQKDRIYAQYRALWDGEGRLLAELSREVAADTAALGITGIVRPELLNGGMVPA